MENLNQLVSGCGAVSEIHYPKLSNALNKKPKDSFKHHRVFKKKSSNTTGPPTSYASCSHFHHHHSHW